MLFGVLLQACLLLLHVKLAFASGKTLRIAIRSKTTFHLTCDMSRLLKGRGVVSIILISPPLVDILQTSALSSGMQVEATEMDLSKIDEGSVDIYRSMQFEP